MCVCTRRVSVWMVHAQIGHHTRFSYSYSSSSKTRTASGGDEQQEGKAMYGGEYLCNRYGCSSPLLLCHAQSLNKKPHCRTLERYRELHRERESERAKQALILNLHTHTHKDLNIIFISFAALHLCMLCVWVQLQYKPLIGNVSINGRRGKVRCSAARKIMNGAPRTALMLNKWIAGARTSSYRNHISCIRAAQTIRNKTQQH